jgi:hypothetical protein
MPPEYLSYEMADWLKGSTMVLFWAAPAVSILMILAIVMTPAAPSKSREVIPATWTDSQLLLLISLAVQVGHHIFLGRYSRSWATEYWVVEVSVFWAIVIGVLWLWTLSTFWRTSLASNRQAFPVRKMPRVYFWAATPMIVNLAVIVWG